MTSFIYEAGFLFTLELMKITYLLVLFILVGSCKSPSTYKKNEGESAKEIFDAIKAKDFDAYKKHLATREDLVNLWELHANNPDFEGFDKIKRVAEANHLIDNIDIAYPKFLRISKELFFKTIDKVESSGIDLSKIKYEGSVFRHLMYEIHTNISFSYNKKMYSFETILYKYEEFIISQGDIKLNKRYSKPIEETVIEEVILD